MLSAKVPFHRSIRFRLSLVIAVVIFAAVMAASALSALRDLRQQSDARAEMLEATASAYSAAVAQPLANRDRRTMLEYMRGMRDIRSVIFMAVKDLDGEILAQLGAGASIRGKTPDLRSLGELDLLNADRDMLRASAENFAHRLTEAEVPHEGWYLPGTSHGFLALPDSDAFSAGTRALSRWLAGA